MRSITRLNRMIDTANGQMPTPRISPFCVSVRSNSFWRSPRIMMRRMNANDVAVRAMKHATNSRFFAASVRLSSMVRAGGEGERCGRVSLHAAEHRLRIELDAEVAEADFGRAARVHLRRDHALPQALGVGEVDGAHAVDRELHAGACGQDLVRVPLAGLHGVRRRLL